MLCDRMTQNTITPNVNVKDDLADLIEGCAIRDNNKLLDSSKIYFFIN